MASRAALLVGALLIVGCVGAALTRMSWLEDHEVRALEQTSLADAPRLEDGPGVILSRVGLERDHVVAFEVCADDPMLPERWEDALSLAVVEEADRQVMTESALNADVLGMVRRNEAAGCLQVGRGTIGQSGDYTIEAHWEAFPEALAQIPIYVRVIARHPLNDWDFLLALGVWAGGFVLLFGFGIRRAVARAETHDPQAAPRGLSRIPAEARMAAGVALMTAMFFVLGHVPVGATGGAALMFAIAGLECALAFGLSASASRSRVDMLALTAPRLYYVFIPAALVSGVLLYVLATAATRLVPSTGVSAIETLVSMPSGLLSFAVPAVVVPLAEELFFRGFVFGALETRSRTAAFLAAWLLFVVAHVPQTLGQWGALVAITVAGLGFTVLRRASGSTLVSATAHLVYNGILALSALA